MNKMEPRDIIALIREAGVLTEITETKLDMEFKTLGIDSLDLYNVLLSLEGKYSVKIPDEDIEKLSTVNKIVHYLHEKTSPKR